MTRTNRLGLASLLFAVAMPVCAGPASARGGKDLDALLGGREIWQMTAGEFAEKYVRKGELGGFEWVSSAKQSARIQHLRHWRLRSREGGRGQKSLAPSIGGGAHELGEVIVRFEDQKVNRVELSIFNRGDDGEISKAEFQKRLRDITGFVEARMDGVRYEERRGSKPAERELLWRGKEDFVLLDYSFRAEDKSRGQRFRPEFILLKFAPAPAGGRLGGMEKRIKARSDLRNELVREDNGDRVIKTIPMVDQGQKGYCAVASAERVMRYYGLDVNQHEMAKISNTVTGGGTSGEEMAEALNAAAGIYHTRVLTLFEFSYSNQKGWRDMEQVTKAYNRAAKKADKRVFEADVIPIRILLSVGDPQILKQVRASGTKYERFKSTVERYVDDGLPVLWALCLGVFPEKGIPQTRGGHMRLIIGYNDRTEEILYSDSWGAGHEVKRMRMDEAYTMTEGMWILQPAH